MLNMADGFAVRSGYPSIIILVDMLVLRELARHMRRPLHPRHTTRIWLRIGLRSAGTCASQRYPQLTRCARLPGKNSLGRCSPPMRPVDKADNIEVTRPVQQLLASRSRDELLALDSEDHRHHPRN